MEDALILVEQATVHGPLITGMREARRILDHLEELQLER